MKGLLVCEPWRKQHLTPQREVLMLLSSLGISGRVQVTNEAMSSKGFNQGPGLCIYMCVAVHCV